ncbi:acetyltransferase (GNAT) family protein [Mariniflexile fucanivorans]|uniref:Acetyltransferase (GNAT) family protein n=1 Tax=Mariniflexile fucanivorans TaxID=264023 RepID=A0A4R1RIQ8_9FLAO|nr:GNAT family N-acetyltransferase [Mariniflexile fucanivorans]TCL65660.1 acetyltransferase (GNAT) family protein [Mariniflexile fucanivorans]
MIRKGTYVDIDKILETTNLCAAHLIEKNIFQWNEHYPNKEVFFEDLKRKELFVLEQHTNLIGCITISTFMDPFYEPLTWLTTNKNNLYIHRLAIHPNYQGHGYAQKLMSFAEAYARKNNFTSIRLDTFSQNTRNLTFYEQRGYTRLDGICFPKQSEYPFYCYELII